MLGCFPEMGAAARKICIQGELVESSMVCSDFERVVEIFKQLFDSGQVARNLMR